jgi:RNA polymerase sigma-70 factor (ECF subfamily)
MISCAMVFLVIVPYTSYYILYYHFADAKEGFLRYNLTVIPNETNLPAGLSNSLANKGLAVQDQDAALVSLARKGDLGAFELLVGRHQKRVFNIAFRLIGDYDDACEVVQDAFVSVYKNIKTFRGEAKFTTWVTTITMNLSKNRLKQMKSRQRLVAFSLDDPIRTEDGQMAVDTPSKEPSVLDQLVKQDVQKRIEECIKKLDHLFREVLILRDMQGFSYEEIGSMLKIREGTVKSRLFRAREMVKDCLKKVVRMI